jgi:hypothetical protein
VVRYLMAMNDRMTAGDEWEGMQEHFSLSTHFSWLSFPGICDCIQSDRDLFNGRSFLQISNYTRKLSLQPFSRMQSSRLIRNKMCKKFEQNSRQRKPKIAK